MRICSWIAFQGGDTLLAPRTSLLVPGGLGGRLAVYQVGLPIGLRAGGALRKQRRGEELTEEERVALGHWQRLSVWRKGIAVGAFAIGTFGLGFDLLEIVRLHAGHAAHAFADGFQAHQLGLQIADFFSHGVEVLAHEAVADRKSVV